MRKNWLYVRKNLNWRKQLQSLPVDQGVTKAAQCLADIGGAAQVLLKLEVATVAMQHCEIIRRSDGKRSSPRSSH